MEKLDEPKTEKHFRKGLLSDIGLVFTCSSSPYRCCRTFSSRTNFRLSVSCCVEEKKNTTVVTIFVLMERNEFRSIIYGQKFYALINAQATPPNYTSDGDYMVPIEKILSSRYYCLRSFNDTGNHDKEGRYDVLSIH